MGKAKMAACGTYRGYDGEIIDCHMHPAWQTEEWTGWFRWIC